MAVHILEDRETGMQCLYCTTTDWAFGPVFNEGEDVEACLEWLKPTDPRSLHDSELAGKVMNWRIAPKEFYCSECGHTEPCPHPEPDVKECSECEDWIYDTRKAKAVTV